ncbi:MAG: flagellar hook-basal body complex protein FliE [Planctomycetota bacterium]|jgi:flagellar hook-basal body complex protein FliE
MTGFDLGSIGGFDIGRFQKEVMRAMSERGPNMIDPPKVGENVPLRPSTTSETVEGKGFDGFLGEAIDTVDSLQKDTQQKVRGMMLGEGVELHDVMIAANKSDMAFSLLLEVRNKLVDAWDKLSRSVM